jgi:hypothetical protein
MTAEQRESHQRNTIRKKKLEITLTG